MGAPRKWTDEQREEALAVFRTHGASEASRRFGVPKPTISRWATEAGLPRDVTNVSRMLSIEAHRLTLAQRRAALAEKLQDTAERLHDRMFAPASIHHWGTETTDGGSQTVFMTQELAEPTFADQKTILGSISLAVDRSLKLTGDDRAPDEGRRVLISVRQAIMVLPPEQRFMVAAELERLMPPESPERKAG